MRDDSVVMAPDSSPESLSLILEAGADVGAPLPLTHLARRLYEAAAADGLGDQDVAAVATALGRWRAGDAR